MNFGLFHGVRMAQGQTWSAHMQEPFTRIMNLVLTQKWWLAPMLEIARTRQICHCTQCQYKPYVYSEQTQGLQPCNWQISTLIKCKWFVLQTPFCTWISVFLQARDSNIGNSRLWVEGPLNPIPGVADLNECSEPGLDANSILFSLH